MNTAELLKAIRDKVYSDSTLMSAIASDVYFESAEPDATMPWITYHIVSAIPERHLSAADDFDEALVMFRIFDDNPGVQTIVDITSDLDLCFDRQTLVYDSKTAIGCIRESGTGPTKMEEDDVWMATTDYRISYG